MAINQIHIQTAIRPLMSITFPPDIMTGIPAHHQPEATTKHHRSTMNYTTPTLIPSLMSIKFTTKQISHIQHITSINTANPEDEVEVPSSEQVAKLQEKDPYCKMWIDFLLDNKKPELSQHHLDSLKTGMSVSVEGLLTYTVRNSQRTDNTAPSRLIVAPLSLMKYILRTSHELSAHLGIAKCIDRVQKQYFRPGIRKIIHGYIMSCIPCASKSGNKRKTHATLQKRKMPDHPFQEWCIDFKGPLTQTLSGNKYILSMVCTFSRYAEAIALPDMKAETVADVLLSNIVSRYGLPETLLSDNAKNFEGIVIKNLCSLLSIKKKHTTSYHPQSNAIIERYHSTLGNGLKMLTNEFQNDWDKMLPLVLLAYRTSLHASLKDSPSFVIFGFDIRLPYDILASRNVPGKYAIGLSPHGHAAETNLRMRRAFQTYKEAMLQEMDKSHARSNTKRKTPQIEVNDLVLLNTPLTKPRLSQKLHKPYCGPYRVTKKISDINLEIQQQGGRKKQVIHIDRTIRYDPELRDKVQHWAEESEAIQAANS